MVHPITQTPTLGAALGEIGWYAPLAAFIAAGVICLLLWQLWKSQRLYALELAEQARQVAEEQDKAGHARLETEAVGRESQAKSEMLATLSREIRAHLNGIIGSADLMLDGSLLSDQRKHLGTLRSSAESLHQSLNDVLDYSSIETGQIKIGHAPFDLRHPLIELVEILSPVALLKGLDLVLIVAPDVPVQVVGDAGRLRQVLLNLMSNAVKFTASGRVVLRVELPSGSSAVSKDGATWLHFSISDTGAGIPEEMQATLFERFAQSDSSARKFGGSGLELAISKRLVELMGGQIGARSVPEGGSEFWVVLALEVDRTKVQGARLPAGGPHIVILDNLAASRVALSAMLTRMGVDHDAADTLGKATVVLREARDEDARELVLLLDDSMVGEIGGELGRVLAQDSALQSTRIILMSRNPEEPATAALGFPVTAVVRKPLLRVEVLLQALRLPKGAAAVRVSSSRVPFEVAGASAAEARRGPHVLVVDDDEISRSVSSQLLRRMGCVVELAVSGAKAIELARGMQFELIFMDCQMPEIDGYTTTERIRLAAGKDAPPIVALTANISAEDREKCFAAGMCDFVGKPVRRAELARVLRRWTRVEGAEQDRPARGEAGPGAQA